jgi:membrane protein
MDNRVTNLFGRAKQLIQSLFSDRALETLQHPVHRFLHFWVFVGRSFVRNRCAVRATGLAYATLLALVPLLAVSLGVSTSLLKSDQDQTRKLIEELVGQVAPQFEQYPGTEEGRDAARVRVVDYIQNFIANIDSGALGLTGMIALVVVAIGLLSSIEASFNDIWGITRGRSWLSRVIHYWTAITLGPLIVFVAMGMAVSAEFLKEPEGLLGRVMLNLAPFLVLALAFALLYQFMPNTKVNWRAALVGGLVGALLWVLNSKFNVVFASRVVAASKIYGALGVFPVFLIGVYVSWLIVLLGAQVTYAVQCRHAYFEEKLSEGLSQRGREFVALRLMLAVADRFHRGVSPASAAELADELGVSPRLVAHLVEPLCGQKLLVEVNATEPAYAPTRPLDRISLDDIIEALRSGAGPDLSTRPGAARESLREAYQAVQRAECQVAGSLSLREMLDRSQSSAEGTRDWARDGDRE